MTENRMMDTNNVNSMCELIPCIQFALHGFIETGLINLLTIEAANSDRCLFIDIQLTSISNPGAR